MKIKATELAKELGIGFDELMERVKRVAKPEQTTGKGKNTWIAEAAADLLRQQQIAPLTVSKRYQARCLSSAPNRRWAICMVEEHGKQPVLLPNRMDATAMTGKFFNVEAIEDTTGITFRHEALSTQ